MSTPDTQERRKWQAQVRKGSLELCILAAVADRPRYGFELIGHLHAYGVPLTEGTMYPLLNRLQGEGLVTAQWRESEAGPPRKYYALTDDGRQALAWMAADWRQLASSVEHAIAPVLDRL